MTDHVSACRTWLYVPGHRDRLLAGAAARGADAVIADLEDAVPSAEAAAARALVGGWLADTSTSPLRAVRVGERALDADLDAVVCPNLDVLVVAKADRMLLERVDEALRRREVSRGMDPGGIPVVALIETAAAVLDAPSIATSPRVALLAIGEADLAADLRIRPSPDERELVGVRTQVVLAAAASGLPAPMGPVCTEYRDIGLLRGRAQAAVAQGFRSLAAIHPAQVPVLTDVLTPSPAEVAEARALLDALGPTDGGAAIGPDGRMVDEAVARQAREVLARADRAG